MTQKWAWILAIREACWPVLTEWMGTSIRTQHRSLFKTLASLPASYLSGAGNPNPFSGACLYILFSPWCTWQYLGRTVAPEQRHYQHGTGVLLGPHAPLPAYRAICSLRGLPTRHPAFAFFLMPVAAVSSKPELAAEAERHALAQYMWYLNAPRV